MININQNELEIVKNILKEFFKDSEIRVFGSRITDKVKPYSDLDLAIISKDPIDLKKMFKAKEAFVDSKLPFRGDLLDWQKIDENFRKIIENKYELL